MQRQSLGSPVSKLHGHGVPKDDSTFMADDDSKRKLDLSSAASSSSSSSPSPPSSSIAAAVRPRRFSSPPPHGPERLIHAIPLLTLLCFLVLFAFSHSPSQSEMAQFRGFNWPAKRIDSAESQIGDIGRFAELRKSDFVAIRSLRNLQEIRKLAPKSRHHRKFADF